MGQELIDKLRGLTAQDLRLWTDARYIARGRSYLSRVGEPKWSDGSLVARVRGTRTYTTELFLDANGDLEAECSCPVGGRCKHAVALALYAAQLSRTGMEFAGETDKNARARLLRPVMRLSDTARLKTECCFGSLPFRG